MFYKNEKRHFKCQAGGNFIFFIFNILFINYLMLIWFIFLAKFFLKKKSAIYLNLYVFLINIFFYLIIFNIINVWKLLRAFNNNFYVLFCCIILKIKNILFNIFLLILFIIFLYYNRHTF